MGVRRLWARRSEGGKGGRAWKRSEPMSIPWRESFLVGYWRGRSESHWPGWVSGGLRGGWRDGTIGAAGVEDAEGGGVVGGDGEELAAGG